MQNFLSAKLCKGFTTRIMAVFATCVNVAVLIEPLPRANLSVLEAAESGRGSAGSCKSGALSVRLVRIANPEGGLACTRTGRKVYARNFDSRTEAADSDNQNKYSGPEPNLAGI
jgi:hypothetical protein